MKRKSFLLFFSLFVLIVVSSGCRKRGTAKSEVIPSITNVVNEQTEGTGDEALDSAEILHEGSARGKVFAEEVMHINLEDVRFEYDSYSLNDKAREILAKNVEALKSNSKLIVQIEGHCDERGTVEYNLALGQKRATAVRNYLVTAGIESGRIFTISYGKEKPVDDSHDEEAWSKNRRAHPIGAVE